MSDDSLLEKPEIPNTEKLNLNKSSQIDLDDFNQAFKVIQEEENLRNLRPLITTHLQKIFARHPISETYLVVFLYDNIRSINEDMTDSIYEAIPEDNNKPILLIIHSSGWEIEPAYLISKTCQDRTKSFIVAVPKQAKSAATLISLGADEIHMGSISEMWPIDPQFNWLPALALSSSLNSIAKVVTEYPQASDMFAKYLSNKLDLSILGYFERVSESAKQYAQRLLKRSMTDVSKIEEVANSLVYEYKDHSFVIDAEEARKYFWNNIKVGTLEYKLASDIHQFLSNLNLIAKALKKKSFAIVWLWENVSVHDTPKR